MRVLHCPVNYAGYASALARAEREIGLDSTAVNFYAEPFAFRCDESLSLDGRSRLGKEAVRWKLLMRAARDFDVIHYHAGETMFPHPVGWGPVAGPRPSSFLGHLFRLYRRCLWRKDAVILRALGKKIFVTFQGTDARFDHPGLAREAAEWCRADDIKRENIAALARVAHGIFFLNPDLARNLPQGARFVPYGTVDPREWKQPEDSPSRGSAPVVLHAPSQRRVKGTRYVEAAMAELARQGFAAELSLVERTTHGEARLLYSEADLLVDQLLIGWYGGLAVELMALGKPVICYLERPDPGVVPADMLEELPIFHAKPETLAQAIRDCLEIRDLGQRGRAFVERWHDPRSIARYHRDCYLLPAGQELPYFHIEAP